MNEGRFSEALSRIGQARKLEPDNIVFMNREIDTLEALGKYDDALALVRTRQGKHAASNIRLVQHEICLLIRKGDSSAARNRVDMFCKELETHVGAPPQIVTSLRNMLEAGLHYAAGDMNAYRQSLTTAQDPNVPSFEGSIANNQLEAAQTALSKMTDPGWSEHMVLYLAARSANNNAIADAAWNNAIELLKKRDRSARLLAQAISTTEPPSDKLLRNWSALPLDRSIMLTALGLRYPQKQPDYFAAARKLNFASRFPQQLIEQATTK
jgi:hypothetical protein